MAIRLHGSASTTPRMHAELQPATSSQRSYDLPASQINVAVPRFAGMLSAMECGSGDPPNRYHACIRFMQSIAIAQSTACQVTI